MRHVFLLNLEMANMASYLTDVFPEVVECMWGASPLHDRALGYTKLIRIVGSVSGSVFSPLFGQMSFLLDFGFSYTKINLHVKHGF